jgi:hypothetical protein
MNPLNAQEAVAAQSDVLGVPAGVPATPLPTTPELITQGLADLPETQVDAITSHPAT